MERPPRGRAGPAVGLALPTHGGANQEDGPGADINTIVGQYRRHGTLPAVQLRNPLYGDFANLPGDLMEHREAMYAAEDRFAELPAAVRSAAGNDWVRFLELFNDPDQRQVLIDNGLIVVDDLEPEPEPAPAAAPPAAPAAAPPAAPAAPTGAEGDGTPTTP